MSYPSLLFLVILFLLPLRLIGVIFCIATNRINISIVLFIRWMVLALLQDNISQ